METRDVGRAHFRIGMSAPPKAELFLNLLDLRPKNQTVAENFPFTPRPMREKIIIFPRRRHQWLLRTSYICISKRENGGKSRLCPRTFPRTSSFHRNFAYYIISQPKLKKQEITDTKFGNFCSFLKFFYKAARFLALSLLMALVLGTDNHNLAVSFDDLALVAHRLNRGSYFHNCTP